MNKPTGELSLVFSRKDNGRTHLSRQYFRLPLQIMMPHYQEEDGTAFVYFLNPGGGVLQHDRLLTEVTIEDGADVFITTPSSTKFYRMDEGHAEVENVFSVGSGATLEYLPEYNVPFAQSSSFQDSVFRLRSDSVLIASDIVTAGRTSRNEIFDYDIYSSKTRIYIDDELKLYDSCRITPETMDPARRGLLEGKLSNGTVYAYAPDIPEGICGRLNAMERDSDIEAAAGLVDGRIITVRFTGTDMIAIKDFVYAVWDILRRELIGKGAVRVRKY